MYDVPPITTVLLLVFKWIDECVWGGERGCIKRDRKREMYKNSSGVASIGLTNSAVIRGGKKYEKNAPNRLAFSPSNLRLSL